MGAREGARTRVGACVRVAGTNERRATRWSSPPRSPSLLTSPGVVPRSFTLSLASVVECYHARGRARSGAQRPTIRLLSTLVTLLARARNRWGNTTPLSTMTSPRRNTGPGRRLDATTGARATQPMYMPSVRTRRAPSVRHRRRRGGGGRCAVDGHPGGRRASYRRRYCCCCCRCGGVATAYAKAEGG